MINSSVRVGFEVCRRSCKGDAAGRRSPQPPLLGDPWREHFFEKQAWQQEAVILNQEEPSQGDRLSTCASPLNAPPYGRRRGSAQAERPTLFIVEVGQIKSGDQNEVVKVTVPQCFGNIFR
jgi:hypothetical protein